MRYLTLLLVLTLIHPCLGADAPAAAEDQKPKVAVFPMGGSASDVLRTHTDKALRTKLDRDGQFDPIDGYTMKDYADQAKDAITFDTSIDVLKDLVSTETPPPVLFIWGDLNKLPGSQGTLRLKILDIRKPGATPIEYTRDVKEETDFRFAYEEALGKIKGVKFTLPNDEDVHHDADSDAEFAKNPNLVIDPNFATEGHWQAFYQSRLWQAKISDDLPGVDDLSIHPETSDGPLHNVLAMNISKECAENNGMACISDPIPILKGIKYRIQFKYNSEGPTALVFVKGYTMGPALDGKPELREIYRRQLSEIPDTKGKWVLHECDLNPQHIVMPVQFLKVDLYVYATNGRCMFSDIQLKVIGEQTSADKMKDAAIKAPLDLAQTRPSK